MDDAVDACADSVYLTMCDMCGCIPYTLGIYQIYKNLALKKARKSPDGLSVRST